MCGIRVLKAERYSFVRRVSKMGSTYLITLPRIIGKKLYRSNVQVTIEVLEETEK